MVRGNMDGVHSTSNPVACIVWKRQRQNTTAALTHDTVTVCVAYLAAHVEQAHVRVLDGLGVGGTGVTVVKGCGVVARGTNAGVGDVARAAVVVAPMLEQ